MSPSPSRSATTAFGTRVLDDVVVLGQRARCPGPGVGRAVQSKPLPLQRVRSSLRMNGMW